MLTSLLVLRVEEVAEPELVSFVLWLILSLLRLELSLLGANESASVEVLLSRMVGRLSPVVLELAELVAVWESLLTLCGGV